METTEQVISEKELNVSLSNEKTIEELISDNTLTNSKVGVAFINGSRIETRVVEYSPEMAERILKERNTTNRKVNKISVNLLSKEMEKGKWVFNGDSIRFNEKGVLIDGQHRLLSIIKSNKSQTIMTITGLDVDTFETIDVGMKRSSSDIMSIYGIEDPTLTASIVKFIYAFKGGKFSANRNTVRNLNNQEIMPYYYTLDGITDSVEFTKRMKKEGEGLISPSIIGGMHYLMTKVDVKMGNDFIEKACLGTNLEDESPIKALRNKLIKAKVNNKYKLTNLDMLANIAQTWNLYKEGVKVQKIRLPKELKIEIK
jgi:hypothetical protein